MVEAGVPVAMATDFNPGSCPSLNMQFVINLGGRPLCVSKERIRQLVAQKVYLPGVTVADIAAVAIYKTR